MNDLEKIESKRKILLISFVVVALAFIIYIINTFTASNIINNVITTFVIFIIFLFCFITMYFVTKRILKNLKNILMQNVSGILKESKFASDMGIPEIIFRDANFIRKYDKYIASNCLAGKLDNNNKFSICDIHVTEIVHDKDGNREITLFDGIFGMIATKNNYQFDINITPDIKNKYINQIMDNIKKLAGVKNIVRLENAEFERYFEVYSDNQIEARKVITINFMEKLLDLRKRFNKNITITYVKNNVYFFVENSNVIKEKSLLFKGLTKEIIDETYNNIKLLLETMNLL